MTKKLVQKALTKALDDHRVIFENMQESSFSRSEMQLKSILKEERSKIDYPIPPVLPLILVWAFVIIFPLVLILDPGYMMGSTINARNMVAFYLPLVVTTLIFIVNQKHLVPNCFFKKRYVRYVIFNTLLIFSALFLREIGFFLVDHGKDEGLEFFFKSYCFSDMKAHFTLWTIVLFTLLVGFVCVISVVYNIFIKQTIRTFLGREQKRAALQYELDFLKNQLSPHFLFNTLNNISALIQFDPKRAEDAMAKLSKLLRVMLYQTSDSTIPIKEDIDILQKYAELEKLRLDENYDLKFDIDLEDENFPIAPLIAMPLVENAIKHSVNPNGKSFAHIAITQKANKVTVETVNSNFPRKAKSNAGGLGLATFKKRLELLYTSRYSYETRIEGDSYHSKLELITD